MRAQIEAIIHHYTGNGYSVETQRRAMVEAISELVARDALDVEGLAVAMNTAHLQCEEIRLGRDLRVPAARIVAAYRGARV